MSGYTSGRLAAYVHVADEQGRTHVFGPSTEVPEWAARKITNDRAWATPPTFPDVKAVTDPDVAGTGEAPARPPTSGKGSGVEAWRAYATARGIAIPEDASRDDIVAEVDAADAKLAATQRAENEAAASKAAEDRREE